MSTQDYVIDNVLCSINNRRLTMSRDQMREYVALSFPPEQVADSREMLSKILERDGLDFCQRKDAEEDSADVDAILNMLEKAKPSDLPTFAATSFPDLDIKSNTTLFRLLQRMAKEISGLKSLILELKQEQCQSDISKDGISNDSHPEEQEQRSEQASKAVKVEISSGDSAQASSPKEHSLSPVTPTRKGKLALESAVARIKASRLNEPQVHEEVEKSDVVTSQEGGKSSRRRSRSRVTRSSPPLPGDVPKEKMCKMSPSPEQETEPLRMSEDFSSPELDPQDDQSGQTAPVLAPSIFPPGLGLIGGFHPPPGLVSFMTQLAAVRHEQQRQAALFQRSKSTGSKSCSKSICDATHDPLSNSFPRGDSPIEQSNGEGKIVDDVEKPYVCQHLNCQKRFTNKFLLKKHEFIHTGERPHQCPFCGKRFNRKDNLLRHKKTHMANYNMTRRRTSVFGVPHPGAVTPTVPTPTTGSNGRFDLAGLLGGQTDQDILYGEEESGTPSEEEGGEDTPDSSLLGSFSAPPLHPTGGFNFPPLLLNGQDGGKGTTLTS